MAGLAFAFALAPLGCDGGSDSGETGGEVVSFSGQIAPIFAAKCNFCHHPDNAIKVDLTAPFDPEVGIINHANSWPDSAYPLLVVPGDPDASALVSKIERNDGYDEDEGNSMPVALAGLTPAELADLRQWIVDGALEEDPLYADKITKIFGDGTSLDSAAGKCAWCHYTGGGLEPDLTKPFDPQTGIVGVPAASGGIRVRPGEPDSSVLFLKVRDGEDLNPAFGAPMPLVPERVTDEEARLIRLWIKQGARAN